MRSSRPTLGDSVIRSIDRNVLAAWLGDDRAVMDALLGKFRETAIEATTIAHRHAALSRPHPVLSGVDLVYPQEEKRAWDAVVTRMSLSLRPREG
jgi:hypothetical protein